MSDDEWAKEVEVEDNIGLRSALHKRHIRDWTPLDSRPRSERPGGFNVTVHQFSEEWNLRWYNPGQAEGGQDQLEWVLKDEVATWLDSRPPPQQGFLVPSPGSPESNVPTLESPLRSLRPVINASFDRINLD